MRQLELSWLRTRYGVLKRERRVLHAQMLRTRSLYVQLQQLLGKFREILCASRYFVIKNFIEIPQTGFGATYLGQGRL